MVKSNDHNDMKDNRNRPMTRSHAMKKPNSRNDKRIDKNDMPSENVTRILLPQHFFTSVQRNDNKFDFHQQLSRSEERYISTLPENKRKFLLNELTKNSKVRQVPLRFRVLQSNIPNKSEILQKLQNSCDNPKYETWVESLLTVPIGKLCPPPIREISEINNFLMETRNEMDRIVYGQYEAKNEIMRLLCQWSASGGLSSFAIALEGPPGIGKTTFAKNVISKVMKRPFQFISLGGATDAAHLVGHSYTYEGAIAGRIVDGLKVAKVMNPCFYFDELDKISKTPKGDEISNILIHLTDREQNSNFHDKYFNGIDFDLSQSLFVFSYNNASNINPILLDRLNIIKFETPSIDEKIEIAKQHLIPKAISSSGVKYEDVEISDYCIEYIITKHTDEKGVRNLEKNLCRIVSTFGLIIHAPEVLQSLNVKKDTEGKVLCNIELIDAILMNTRKEDKSYLFMYH